MRRVFIPGIDYDKDPYGTDYGTLPTTEELVELLDYQHAKAEERRKRLQEQQP